VTVRSAAAADATAVQRLQSLLDQPAPRLLGAALDGHGGEVLVATAAREVVGYTLVVPGSGCWYLAELAVAPDARRAGHGSRLVAAVAARADGEGELRVTVAADDDRARAFYAALGFRRRERLPERFGDRDGLLLGRPA
jgi:ribosomal-protein-alanine N-acetyltransferase